VRKLPTLASVAAQAELADCPPLWEPAYADRLAALDGEAEAALAFLRQHLKGKARELLEGG
jgi:hypothetical protein